MKLSNKSISLVPHHGASFSDARAQETTKRHFSKLVINCQVQSNFTDLRVNEVIIPEEACEEERNIHAFLDKLQVKAVNMQDLIEENQKIDSPEVRRLFNQRFSDQKEDTTSRVSHNSVLTKSNLFMRRKLLSLNAQPQADEAIDTNGGKGQSLDKFDSPIDCGSQKG